MGSTKGNFLHQTLQMPGMPLRLAGMPGMTSPGHQEEEEDGRSPMGGLQAWGCAGLPPSPPAWGSVPRGRWPPLRPQAAPFRGQQRMQVTSTSTRCPTRPPEEHGGPRAGPGGSALAAALSTAWAWRRKCWFRRRPSRRSARMATVRGPACRDTRAPAADSRQLQDTLTPGRGGPRLRLKRLGHPAFLGVPGS